MSRFGRGPRRRPLSSLSSRDIDRLREFSDLEAEFRENSGVEEAREDERERTRQERWMTVVDEDVA